MDTNSGSYLGSGLASSSSPSPFNSVDASPLPSYAGFELYEASKSNISSPIQRHYPGTAGLGSPCPSHLKTPVIPQTPVVEAKASFTYLETKDTSAFVEMEKAEKKNEGVRLASPSAKQESGLAQSKQVETNVPSDPYTTPTKVASRTESRRVSPSRIPTRSPPSKRTSMGTTLSQKAKAPFSSPVKSSAPAAGSPAKPRVPVRLPAYPAPTRRSTGPIQSVGQASPNPSPPAADLTGLGLFVAAPPSPTVGARPTIRSPARLKDVAGPKAPSNLTRQLQLRSPPQAIVLPDRFAAPAVALVKLLNGAIDINGQRLDFPISQTEFQAQRSQMPRKSPRSSSGSDYGSGSGTSNGSKDISDITSSSTGSDGSEEWETIAKLDVGEGARAVPLSRMNSLASTFGARKRLISKKPAPLDIPVVHRNYGSTSYSPQLTPFNGGHHPSGGPSSPALAFGFAGFSWGVPPTPTMGATPAAGGGRGMFAKLFDWKSPNLHLSSTQSLIRTRDECFRMLKALGAVVIATETGGFKCRVDEIVDASGNYTDKTVRFRVEINTFLGPSTPVSPVTGSSGSIYSEFSALPTPNPNQRRVSTGAERSKTSFESVRPGLARRSTSSAHSSSNKSPNPYRPIPARTCSTGSQLAHICTVTFIQDRGAYSTLKVVFSRIQENWKLDQLAREDPLRSCPIPSRRASASGILVNGQTVPV